jgi:hypothetical protein
VGGETSGLDGGRGVGGKSLGADYMSPGVEERTFPMGVGVTLLMKLTSWTFVILILR